ncbi:hypothetical protein F2Q68_00044157 [Brassica cretica]|uniref:Uncharacterized protein n=2 Tax=Brassica cretica TaxID=69181 RepID=A0A8S9LI74_BRACR|nr:hypothetical protein F2Q68_00044157 [Brassica cretica]KAF3517629.1 hypothetical protein DY000_02060195 [Brassica cretica]
MENFLELEEWLEDMDQNTEKKLDDHQHTSRGDLETSPKASIDRQSADSIDLHPHSIIDRHPPDCVDRHSWLDELPGYVVEIEPNEERVHESEASRNVDSKHLRPLIWTEEATEFHKRVKRIHDPVKFVVPCAHVEASQRGLRFRDEVDNGPAEPVSIATDRIPSIDTNKQASIDTTTSPSIDTTPSPLIDTTTSSSLDTRRVSEQRSSMCVEILGMEIPPRDQTSLGEEEEKKDQGWSSGIIDPSLLILCKEIQSAQQMLLKAICKGSSSPYC